MITKKARGSITRNQGAGPEKSVEKRGSSVKGKISLLRRQPFPTEDPISLGSFKGHSRQSETVYTYRSDYR